MSPKRKVTNIATQQQNPALAALASVGQLIATYPSIVGGGTAFIIIFSFISMNALYYQKGVHPAPILNMRGPQNIVSGSTRPASNVRQAIGNNAANQVNDGVKTFRVQRGDDIKTSTINPPIPAAPREHSQPAPTQTTQPSVQTPVTNIERVISGDDTVRAVQTELAKYNLYLAEIDGLMGPNTKKAIEAFQTKHGLAVDGVASQDLYLFMRNLAETKEVASLSQTQGEETYSQELVRKIQIGLSRSAYPHVEVDGLVGAQTRDAIRQFEKHYRLPETGSPNTRVLKKLESIGAL